VFDLGDNPIIPKDSNRRRQRRRATRMRAWADPGGAAPVVDCLVVDISEGGASLVAVGGGELPDTFQLQLDTKQSLGEVEVKWRKGAAAGVAFAKAEKKS
jgi:hypothetical protein